MSNFKFEDYRQPWETGPHWELKKEFMEKYQNDFPEDRLLCLAQAYSNMELMHCSYPAPVMLQIHELSKSLHECKRFREASKLKEEEKNASRAQKGKRSLPGSDTDKTFKFIKFCSAVTTVEESSGNSLGSECMTPSINPVPDCNLGESKNKDCNSMDISDTHNTHGCKNIEENTDFVLHLANSPDFKEIEAVANQIQSNAERHRPIVEIENAVLILNLEKIVSYKFDTSFVENMPMCFGKFYIGNTLVSIGRDNNERNARTKAAEYAIEVLLNLHNLPCKTLSDLKTFWIGENINFLLQHENCCKEKKLSLITSKNASFFVVKEGGNYKDFDQTNIEFWIKLAQEISKQAGKNLTTLQILDNAIRRISDSKVFYFNFNEKLNTPLHSRTFCCTLVIEKTVVSQGEHTSKKKAKYKAAENAVNYMINLFEWHESIQKSGKILGSSNVQSNLSLNSQNDLSSKYSEFKESTASSKGFCENSLSNDKSVEYLSGMMTENEAHPQANHKRQEAGQVSNSELAQENIQVSNIIKGSVISSSEIKVTIKRNFPAKPFNHRLLQNSYNKQLVVFDTSEIFSAHQTPSSLLNYSALFCQKQMTYIADEIFSASGEIEKYRFHCIFDGEKIGTGEAFKKTEAKVNAACSALENLKRTVYTIKVKNEVEEGFVITRSQVIDGDYSVNAVSDNNIGCKMLKMMGWSGGAIGKSGGITEPIVASDHNFHQGLGFKNRSRNIGKFKQKIDALLKDFSQTNTTSDLIFSKDFSKEERKDIHRLALRYHLSSISRGKDENRQLYIRRKMSINEILNLIVKSGGSTSKYEMVDCSQEYINHSIA